MILLDVVLGYGAHPDPASELVPILEGLSGPAVLCSVTGTDGDPQDRRATIAALERANALVLPSNASACRIAAHMIRSMGA